MTTGNARPEVIDSDGHVVEPDTLWKDYSEPEFREQLDLPGGGWVQATRDHARVPGPRHRAAGKHAGRRRHELGRRRHGRVVGGGSADEDGAAGRVRPERAPRRHGRRRHRRRGALPHRDARRGSRKPTCSAPRAAPYNNWLRDYCAAAPTRLYGVGLVPLQDVDAAITEMRRCVRDLVVQGGDDPAGGVHRRRRS